MATLSFSPWALQTLEQLPPLEPEPELELTFGTEPLIGWRCWKVASYLTLDGERGPVLISWSRIAQPWLPGRATEAQCKRTTTGALYYAALHAAPQSSCSCGLWAFRSRDDLDAEDLLNSRDSIVFGRVALWGRVLEFARGYRAQFAYPLGLMAYDDQYAVDWCLRLLGERYGVPAALVRRHSPFEAAQVEETPSTESTTVSFPQPWG